jgi:hypothetical protein
MSYTKNVDNIDIDDKNQWNILLSIMSSPNCESSLRSKIDGFISSTFYLFPNAAENFKKRLDININKDDESILMVIFRDIIDFQVHVSLIEPLINELKSRKIITEEIPPQTFKDTTASQIKNLIKIDEFIKLIKIPTSIYRDEYTDAELHLNIISRYYSVLSTIELKELICDLKTLIKNDKKPQILPLEIPHIVLKSGVSITTQRDRENSINRLKDAKLKVKKSDLSQIKQIINQNGGAKNHKPTSNKIVIDGSLIDKYNNFILNTKYISDPKIERDVKIRAGLRIIGTTVTALLGLFCSVGTIIPVIGAVAVVTCPTLKIGSQIINLFIETSLSQNAKKIENSVDDRELLLFTLAKNSNIAWRLDDCPELSKRKTDKSCNVLLNDEDGYERTWYEFIIDILGGTMTTHNIYNLCFVTMSSKICINTTHIDLIHNYDMLGDDINYIIKNINNRDSSFINYIKRKNYDINYVIKELTLYMDKCFYNAECIDQSRSLLETVESNIAIKSLIDEIFDLIKNKINNLNVKYKTIISDRDLKSAIKCIIKFILNPSKDFPLKDKTNKGYNGVTTYNLDYNSYLWGNNLEGKCIFDSKEDGTDDKIILKLKKASVIENIKLLKKFRGSDNKNTLLQISIDAVIEIITKRFKPLPSFYYNLEKSSSDYKEYLETTQTYRTNSSEISPKETVSISEVCGRLGMDNIFDKNTGNITDECMAEITKYINENCSSSLSPSRQLSEMDLNYINLQKCKRLVLDTKFLNSSCGTEPNFPTTECRVNKIKEVEDVNKRKSTVRSKLPPLITLSSDSVPRSNIIRLPSPSKQGGSRKINILGRDRKIINKNKKDYIRFNNELITITEAKKLNKINCLNKVSRTPT